MFCMKQFSGWLANANKTVTALKSLCLEIYDCLVYSLITQAHISTKAFLCADAQPACCFSFLSALPLSKWFELYLNFLLQAYYSGQSGGRLGVACGHPHW